MGAVGAFLLMRAAMPTQLCKNALIAVCKTIVSLLLILTILIIEAAIESGSIIFVITGIESDFYE